MFLRLARLRLKLFVFGVAAWSVGVAALFPVRVVAQELGPGTPVAGALTGSSFHLAALVAGACALLGANVVLGYWNAVSEDSAWQLLGRAFERWR